MLETDEHDRSGSRRLGWAAALTGSFMVAEAIGGYLAGSLALLADAGHMLTDTAALAMAFVAARLASRPADPRRSYGYKRVRVLAALVNSLALLALVGWLVIEAVQRLLEPRDVDAYLMLAIALVGAALNAGVMLLLRHPHDHDINVSAAYAHVISDLAGSIAASAAALIILATGWTRADPLLSLLIAILIGRLALRLLRRSAHILMEGTPEGLDPRQMAVDLSASLPAVQDVHHVHAWSLGSSEVLVTLHARLRPGEDADTALRQIKLWLAETHGVTHSTVQIEHGVCVDDRV